MRNYILCDIDHTLSNAAWRDDMIGGEGGWDAYHAASVDDEPVTDICRAICLFNFLDHDIIALTTRPEKWRDLTMKWMMKHGISVDELLMRPNDDYRPEWETKLDLAVRRFGSEDGVRQNVAFILDDSETVATAFRGLGITVLQVFARRD